MLRVALRPRFLGLLALMVAATLVCGLLATWQWDRAHRALTQETGADRSLGQLQDVIDPGQAVTNELVGGMVEARGTYDPEQQVLVPDRRIDGEDAVIIVTALHVPRAGASEALLPVARGWVPADEVTDGDGDIDPSLAPAPPTGTVSVTGRLEASESASTGITDDVAGEIATPLLVNEWGSPMYAGYVGVSTAQDGLQAMPEAESAFSSGLNWQNLGYALQWVLFAAFFLYLWWRSVRTAHLDELAERREQLESRLAASAAADDASQTTVGRSPADGDADHPRCDGDADHPGGAGDAERPQGAGDPIGGPSGAAPTTKGETGADSAPTR